MSEADLLNRMDGFESRMLRLEELLGLHRIIPVRKPEPVVITQPMPVITPAVEELPELLNEEVASDPMRAPVPVMPYRPVPIPAPLKQSGLEQTIGLKWAGWVGAVVLVIGAGLGIKFGYDQGWFQIVPPVARLVLLAFAGALLIATGEWVYRKVNVLSAVGLFGAGVAILFIASYSGHAYYDLYPRNTAFIFMGVCTVIGALVSRRGNMVSIAVLSMVGGNLAPALLSEGHPQLTGFLTYLLMLQATSLTLAFWGAKPKWWTLRGLSLVTTCLWMLAVIDQSNPSLLLTFTLIFAGLFQLELILSAAKSRLNPQQAGTTFSMFVTVAMTVAVLCVLQDSSQMVRLSWIVGFAGMAGWVSFICSRITRNSNATLPLSYGYALQSLALVVVAVPIAFSGIWIAAAWGGLAIALAALGWYLELPVARYSAWVVWALAVAEVVVWMSGVNDLHRERLIGLTIADVAFPQYVLMSWLLALQGQVVAKVIKSSRNQPPSLNAQFFAKALSVTASGLWVEAALTGLSPLIATTSVLGYAGVLAMLDMVDIELNLLLQSIVLAVAATLKWAVVDLLSHRVIDPVRAESIFFSTQGFASAALLATLLVIYLRVHAAGEGNPQNKHFKRLIVGTLIGVFFWLGSFGLDQEFINLRLSGNAIFSDPERAEQVALSIFWSFFAIASIAVGFGWRTAALRYVGLALFGLTLLKAVAIDLSQVSTGYRILSFMGLGLLLLGTSVLYGKVSPIILANGDPQD